MLVWCEYLTPVCLPTYVPGWVIAVGTMLMDALGRANGVIIVLVTIMVVHFTIKNRQAEKGLAVIEGLPSFRYVL